MASTEMPAISSAGTPPSSIAALTAPTSEDHHSLGSCSAQPGRGCFSANSRSVNTTGVPSGSKMPTLAPPSRSRFQGDKDPQPSACSFFPTELIPQIARDELVYPFQRVVGQIFLWLVGQFLGGGLAGQDDRRG